MKTAILVALAAASAVFFIAAQAQPVKKAIIADVMAGTVTVLPQVPRRARNDAEPEGTAFAVGDGRTLVTADHVLGDAKRVLVRLADGSVSDARIVMRDRETDLALLSINKELPALEFADSILLGEPVCAFGNAFGLGASLSCGVVSAVNRSGVGFNRIEDFIQTDAAINPGMSGAPLITIAGKIAGTVSAIFTKGRDGDLGVNFAVSAALTRAVLDDIADGRIDRRKQGLLLRAEPPPGKTGMAGGRIMRIEPGSSEAQSDLAEGDLVMSINGRAVFSHADYLASLALAGSGDMVFAVDRNKSLKTIRVANFKGR